MATASTIVHNEVLCYLQNNSSSIATDILTTRQSGFYVSDEISSAKILLFAEAEKLKANGAFVDLPRMINRRNGEGKKKADIDDVMDLWNRLDVSKVSLPLFCAINLSRIPPLSFSSADICSLFAMVHEVK